MNVSCQVKIVPRKVIKKYSWYCEVCKTEWVYNHDNSETQNWDAFLIHTLKREEQYQRCQTHPKIFSHATRYTDVRILSCDL